jgi:multidrug efflux pump subunit AcrA (membrane-fusion protein)
MQASSTQLVVTVDLDASKQSEAVVGEPVTVQMPNGTTVNGKISAVSPVAQTSSGSSSEGGSTAAPGGSGSGGGATIPVTVTLKGHRSTRGLDQAAVSVNFEQQVENNVLSVPVTALLATQGGGYAVQEEAAPHKLVRVTPGLFAAGYVQISGTGIYSGLRVTDSHG